MPSSAQRTTNKIPLISFTFGQTHGNMSPCSCSIIIWQLRYRKFYSSNYQPMYCGLTGACTKISQYSAQSHLKFCHASKRCEFHIFASMFNIRGSGGSFGHLAATNPMTIPSQAHTVTASTEDIIPFFLVKCKAIDPCQSDCSASLIKGMRPFFILSAL